MQSVSAEKDLGAGPVRSEAGLLLLLTGLSLAGCLMWVGVIEAIHWSLLAAWAALGG
jgi:hypothetical protein